MKKKEINMKGIDSVSLWETFPDRTDTFFQKVTQSLSQLDIIYLTKTLMTLN